MGGDAEECIVAQQVRKQRGQSWQCHSSHCPGLRGGWLSRHLAALRTRDEPLGRSGWAQWEATVRPGGPAEVADSAALHTQIESNTAAELLDCLEPDDAERESMLANLFSEPSLDDDDDYDYGNR